MIITVDRETAEFFIRRGYTITGSVLADKMRENIIKGIMEINRSATLVFLLHFETADLRRYLRRLLNRE